MFLKNFRNDNQMATKLESIIAPLSSGEGTNQAVKIFGYIISTGLSTLLGIWANGAIKNKATTVNPSIVDGLQIGAGIGIAMIKNPYAQAIGIGQGIAGATGLMGRGINAIKSKMSPVGTISTSIGDGWL